MNVGSLFSGIGGIDLGLERAGHRVVFQCESDAYRRRVLAERFPEIRCYEDVRDISTESTQRSKDNAEIGRHFVTGGHETAELPIDLLCGGFPCQDLSIAGKRTGLSGDRSGLFHEFVRIADSLRPRLLLLENVPGLFSSNQGRDFGIVLRELVRIGYGVAWRVLDSRFFGVPQRRRRVFIVGTRIDGDPRAAAERSAEILSIGSCCPRHPASGREVREDFAEASLSGIRSCGPDDNDGQAGRIVAHSLRAEGFDASEDGTGRGTSMIAYPLRKGRTIADSYGNHGNIVSHPNGVRRLLPVECERLQGFPDGWTDLGGTSDGPRYAALGDAVSVPVAEWIGRRFND